MERRKNCEQRKKLCSEKFLLCLWFSDYDHGYSNIGKIRAGCVAGQLDSVYDYLRIWNRDGTGDGVVSYCFSGGADFAAKEII
jgi:hypothetical protein